MSKLAWLITGLLVGGALGFLTAALCQAAAWGDQHLRALKSDPREDTPA